MSSGTGLLHKATATVNGMSLYYVGEVAVIEMDNGENRVNNALITGFNALLDQVESNELCKGLITTGKGKFYGNGLDLPAFANLPVEDVTLTLMQFLQLLKRILTFPIPTLAALNGHAFAAGGLLALVHDVRTMRLDKGWICFNEVFINRRLGGFNLRMMELKLGMGRAYNDAAVLGKRFTAQDAFQSGMVHSIQPINLLLRESVSVLKSFYGQGYLRDSLKAMKCDVYKAVLDVYDEENIDGKVEDAKKGILSMQSKL